MIPTLYILLVAGHAYWDARKIKKGIIINHKLEAIGYLIISVLLSIFLAKWFSVLPLILFPLLTRAAFFDPVLNLFLGKSWLYEGVQKPKNKESWFDRLERNIGWPTYVYRIFYFAIYLIYLIIYL